MYCLTVLEDRSSRARCWQGCFFQEALRENLSQHFPSAFLFLKNIYLVIFVVLDLSCGMKNPQLQHLAFSSPARNGIPGPLHWELGVLATEPPGKFQLLCFFFFQLLCFFASNHYHVLVYKLITLISAFISYGTLLCVQTCISRGMPVSFPSFIKTLVILD